MDVRRALFLLPAVLLLAVMSGSSGRPALDAPIVEAAGGGSPVYGGILRLAASSNPLNCEVRITATTSIPACAPMFNQLVKYDPLDPQAIVPDAAQSWELSGDGKTWTFHLKPGIKLHNGAALTAADAKFSLERAMGLVDGTLGFHGGLLVSYIQSVEAIDNVTLRVTTEFPAPSLLANLASVHMAIYPQAVVEALSPPSFQTPCQVIASGPFKCQQYTAGDVTKLVRHPDYFVPDRPYLDGIDVFIVADATTRLAALKTGAVHAIPLGITTTEAAGLESFGVTVQQMTGNVAVNLILNTTQPPFNDIRVRRATNLALDRDAAATIMGGTKGDLMMPGGLWALPQATLLARAGYGNKAAERLLADQLLSEAGYPNGFSATITTRSGNFQTAADFVAVQLEAVESGMNLIIEVVDSSTNAQKLANKTYQLAIDTASAPVDDVDLMFYREYLCTAAANFTGLCDAQIETLFSQQQQLLDPAARLSKVHELTNKTMDQHAFLVLGWDKQRIPVRNVVADFQAHPNLVQNLRWQDVWFDLAPPPTPTPTPIPSLGQWGIVLLASFFGTLIAWRLNRKPKASV